MSKDIVKILIAIIIVIFVGCTFSINVQRENKSKENPEEIIEKGSTIYPECEICKTDTYAKKVFEVMNMSTKRLIATKKDENSYNASVIINDINIILMNSIVTLEHGNDPTEVLMSYSSNLSNLIDTTLQ